MTPPRHTTRNLRQRELPNLAFVSLESVLLFTGINTPSSEIIQAKFGERQLVLRVQTLIGA
jgi:hypothetical protein